MATEAKVKKRVVIPRGKPTPPKKTRAELRFAILNSKMKFGMTWEELRALTREP
jgi:hypothetical protein